MKLSKALVLIGVSMSSVPSQATVTYLTAERRVEAHQPNDDASKSTNATGVWIDSVTLGSPGPSVGASQRSTLAQGGINYFGAPTGSSFTSAFSSLMTRVRLTEQTLITFSGDYVRFGIPDGSEISASIVGGEYAFNFAALNDQSPTGTFGATNILLQPGDYDINLLAKSINFEAITLTFNLTFTTVPAPGAAGLAMASLGAAGLRRSRRRDQRGRIAIPRCTPARVFDIGYSKPVH